MDTGEISSLMHGHRCRPSPLVSWQRGHANQTGRKVCSTNIGRTGCPLDKREPQPLPHCTHRVTERGLQPQQRPDTTGLRKKTWDEVVRTSKWTGLSQGGAEQHRPCKTPRKKGNLSSGVSGPLPLSPYADHSRPVAGSGSAHWRQLPW